MKTSEFTDDMDELFYWIDETENILSSTVHVRPEEEHIEELLEKVKVRLYEFSFSINLYEVISFLVSKC